MFFPLSHVNSNTEPYVYRKSLEHLHLMSLIWSGSCLAAKCVALLFGELEHIVKQHTMCLKDLIWFTIMLKSERAVYLLHPSFCVSDTFFKSHIFLLSMFHMQFKGFYFCLVNVLLWLLGLPFILTLHIHYLMLWSFLCLTAFVFPTIFLLLVCLVLLCLCVHVCMSVFVCMCMHTCWHGSPEEEGRPRRRRTPRFLLKPWTRSRQATESRLGLQVKKNRREN